MRYVMKYVRVAAVIFYIALNLAAGLPVQATSDVAPVDEIVAVGGLNQAPPPAPVAAPQDGHVQVSGQVIVTGQVAGIRIIVVDDSNMIIQVWSNTDNPASLRVRQTSRYGAEIPMSDAIIDAYNKIAPTIPLGARGLVYQP